MRSWPVLAVLAAASACSFDSGTGASSDAADAPGCTGGACRRKTITIDATKVSGGPHAMFPVVIHLASDADLAAHARPDGFDITFAAVDGTPLAYERTRFVATTGELIAWVAVPSLPATTDTVLYMYYGDPLATDRQAPASVWPSSYQGVWHLDETGAKLGDSTSLANHASAENMPGVGGDGKIGGAVALNTTGGTTERVVMPDSESLDTTATAATFELWLRWTTTVTSRYQRVLISSNVFNSTRRGYELSAQPDGDFYFYPCEGQTAECSASNYNLVAAPFTNGRWHYVAVTLDWATKDVDMYIDGRIATFDLEYVPGNWTTLATPEDWYWGSTPYASGYFNGSIDELRVSNLVRSAEWIATSYANQDAPSAFYAIGPEVITEP